MPADPSDEFNDGYFGTNNHAGTYGHFQGQVARDKVYGTNYTGMNPATPETRKSSTDYDSLSPPIPTPVVGHQDTTIWGFIIAVVVLLGLLIAYVYFETHNENLPSLQFVVLCEAAIVLAVGLAFFGIRHLLRSRVATSASPPVSALAVSAPPQSKPTEPASPTDSPTDIIDTGSKLLANSKGPVEVLKIVHMVSQAKQRGWNEIHLTGGDAQFQESVWLEAQRQGMTVANYKPSPSLRSRINAWKETVEAATKNS